jgi:hypothetical protein
MAKAAVSRKGTINSSSSVYQLRIGLADITPQIWRSVLVPASVSLAQLYQILQIAMGWTDSHLHEFAIGRTRYGIPDPDWLSSELVIAEERVTLAEALGGTESKFAYRYDFGDAWEHELRIENTLPLDPGTHYPQCLAGANACPPEDVGGPFGYLNFLQTIRDPRHQQHAEMLRWCGGSFDPVAFNLAAVNAASRRIRR